MSLYCIRQAQHAHASSLYVVKETKTKDRRNRENKKRRPPPEMRQTIQSKQREIIQDEEKAPPRPGAPLTKTNNRDLFHCSKKNNKTIRTKVKNDRKTKTQAMGCISKSGLPICILSFRRRFTRPYPLQSLAAS